MDRAKRRNLWRDGNSPWQPSFSNNGRKGAVFPKRVEPRMQTRGGMYLHDMRATLAEELTKAEELNELEDLIKETGG